MKFLALLLVVGCASAAFYDALENASDEVVQDFLIGMDRVPSLKESVGVTYDEELDQIEEDVKTELGKSLKQSLDEVLKTIRDSVDHGKIVAKELLEKAKEVTQKLKELKKEAGGKAKELIERVKEHAREWFKKLLERVGLSKRSLVDIIDQLNLSTIIENLKQKIFEKLDVQAIRDYVKKVFGEFSATGSALLNALKNQGIRAVRDLVNLILPRRIDEPKELQVKVIGHVEKRWVGIAKAACIIIKFMANGWTKNMLQNWIDNNVGPQWHGTLSNALKFGLPALRAVLGRFCYAAAPQEPIALVNYSLVDLWARVRGFLRGLGVELQEKFLHFVNWIKAVVNSGLLDAQDKLSQVKQIAQQFIEHGKTLTKEVAEEAKQFFLPYAEDLGALWEEVQETIRNVIGRAA